MRRASELDSPRNSCRIEVGRLLEIDVRAGYRTVADVDAMIAMMGHQFQSVPEPERVVIAADWRACNVLTPAVAERVVQMLARSNPRMERSAILHDPSQSTSVFQAFRLAQEAESASRRVFTDPFEMETWLAEVLTPLEVARVRALLHKPSHITRP